MKRARGFGALLIIATAGCVPIPKFRGDAGPPEDTGSGDGGIDGGVSGRVDYAINFGTLGAHYPDHLTIEGVEMLGTGASCNDENLVGIADFPAFRIDAMSGLGTMEVIVQAVAPLDLHKVTLRWAQAHETCDATRSMTGRSTFTMFPDGRIMRFDHVAQGIGNGTAMLPGTCSCSAASGMWYLTSYLSLRSVARIELGSGIEVTPTGGNGTSIPGRVACAENTTGQRVAVLWPFAPDRRVRSVAVGGSTAFVLDLINPSSTQSDVEYNQQDHATQLLVGGSGGTCKELNDRLGESVIEGDPQLDISTNGVPGGSPGGTADVDGIFGGEQYNSTEVGILIDGTKTVLLTTPTSMGIPPGWAVWLRYEAGRPGTYEVTSTAPLAASDYHIQELVDGTTIVWFRRRLDPGTMLTLTPRSS